MQIRVFISLGFLTVATLLAAQQPSQTVTDGEGNKLTFSTDGIMFESKDGTTKHIPATWLNENCPDLSKTGITDSNDLAGLKEICDNWSKFNEQGTETQSIVEPPRVIPDNCSISEVVSVSTHGRSDAYNLLGYEIAALHAGHQAESNNALAMKSMKSDFGTDPTAILADVFQNLSIATNEYRCGAFIEGQYQATGEKGQIDRATAISVYNRLAIINTKMKKYVEDQFKSAGNQDTTAVVDNANTLANLTNDRQAALSDLVNATTLSAFLSIYTGDPSASVADTLNMSAAEREQLLVQLNRILQSGSPDGFTKAADLLRSFLNTHSKVRK